MNEEDTPEEKEVLIERPNCPHCGQWMANMTTQVGVALFSCRSRLCRGSREYYRKDGSRR